MPRKAKKNTTAKGGRPQTKTYDWPTDTSFVKAKPVKIAGKSRQVRTSKDFIAGLSTHVQNVLKTSIKLAKEKKVKTLSKDLLKEALETA